MTSTAIDADSICRIIKECGKSRVSRFKVEGLEIEFISSDRPLELSKTNNETELALARPPESNAENMEPPKVYLTEEDKEAFRQMDELQLAIDDPIAYEQQMIDESMENARTKLAGPSLNAEPENRGSQQTLF